MTKTSIFGHAEQKEKKPIRLVKCFNGFVFTVDGLLKLSGWDNITLLAKDYGDSKMDLMWAYNDDLNNGVLYLGHWNDGVV